MTNNIANPASDQSVKTILLRGTNVPHSERPAGAAGIYPGYFLDINSSGEFIAYASTKKPAAIARENSIMGGSIDTVYASGDQVLAWHPRAGDWVLAWLEEEANVAIGDELEMNGAGVLQAVTSGTPVAKALEAKDVRSISGPVRIKVQII